MGLWKKQSSAERQFRLQVALKKAIAQLEKRRAQLEKQFRTKYTSAQVAKETGDKEEAIRLLEECQLITDEQNDIKKEIFRLNRAESLVDYLIMAPEVSALLRTTTSAEEIDPAKVLGIVSNLEQHIAQTKEADEKLGTLPADIDSQGLPSLPIVETRESDLQEETSLEEDINSVHSHAETDSITKSKKVSKNEKETEL
ncbi:MAG: hypothetical protein ACFFA5_05720 [Promethearchaeota archaeon]